MWNKERIQALLDSNPRAVYRAVLAIYARQTSAEQAAHATTDSNGVGFSAFDAEFLTDMAKRIQRGWSLSPKQLAVTRNKIKRYHRQLVEIAQAKEAAKVEAMAMNAEAAEADPYSRAPGGVDWANAEIVARDLRTPDEIEMDRLVAAGEYAEEQRVAAYKFARDSGARVNAYA